MKLAIVRLREAELRGANDDAAGATHDEYLSTRTFDPLPNRGQVNDYKRVM